MTKKMILTVLFCAVLFAGKSQSKRIIPHTGTCILFYVGDNGMLLAADTKISYSINSKRKSDFINKIHLEKNIYFAAQGMALASGGIITM